MVGDLKEIRECEVCGSQCLRTALSLGTHPLCDDLVPIGEYQTCREYPIEILLCQTCVTAHQRFQVPKLELFPATYHYRSRFTADVLNGMGELVGSCEQAFGLLNGKTVLDIGCNDGSLLDLYRLRGAVTLGVEPTDACRDAAARGHITFSAFLSEELADEIVESHGKPDFITLTNVFAHIDDLRQVVESLRKLMAPHTIIVIENHYLGAVLRGSQFDTFYHEHPRTYSYTSFIHVARSLRVAVLRVQFPLRYGGNIRVFLGQTTDERKADAIDEDLLRREREDFYGNFAELQANVERWREAKRRSLSQLVERFGKLRAKAFPGRAAILVKLLGLDERLISAVFEKPGSLKIGYYVPGTRIPIRSDEELFAEPDKTLPVLNLAWHIPGEIRAYLTKHGYVGPVVDILDADDLVSGP